MYKVTYLCICLLFFAYITHVTRQQLKHINLKEEIHCFQRILVCLRFVEDSFAVLTLKIEDFFESLRSHFNGIRVTFKHKKMDSSSF